ncbi:DUF7847 domain-containing protein [Candidatus Methanocrinis natronophilus]|uniref:DUF7847 domain-containing protein n=1 Tax=Candidatus Methanocrinis natronophilus TaxID=3033396 RepID=A0ABT5X8Z7_9EURY|nr:hypothetical protein [Candidatus Methanocrinis natronophilus]MDF0591133.1 hypothetical protein [Candidatus Methanocrinis natronophilus]
MYEDIGTLIRRGFETWRQNLILALPFVLMVVFIVVIAIAAVIAAFYPLITGSPELFSTAGDVQSPEEMAELLSSATNLGMAAAILLVGILLIYLASSFFTAGAIGMAREATDVGKTSTKEMWASGRRHYLNLFIAEVLMMVFIIAGALVLSLPFLSDLMGILGANEPEFGPIILWVFLVIAYGFIISVALAIVPYALVLSSLGPIEAIRSGIRFFLSNKMDVFLIWLVVIAVSMAIQFLGLPFSGSETASTFFSMLTGILSVLVISPLTTVWWTRLYMTRTGKIREAEPVRDEEVKYL